MTGPYRACMKFEDVQKLFADRFGDVSSIWGQKDTAFHMHSDRSTCTKWSLHISRYSAITDWCNARPLSRNSFTPFHCHSTTCCSDPAALESWSVAQRNLDYATALRESRTDFVRRHDRIPKNGNDTRGKHHVMKSSRPSPSFPFRGVKGHGSDISREGEGLEIEATLSHMAEPKRRKHSASHSKIPGNCYNPVVTR